MRITGVVVDGVVVSDVIVSGVVVSGVVVSRVVVCGVVLSGVVVFRVVVCGVEVYVQNLLRLPKNAGLQYHAYEYTKCPTITKYFQTCGKITKNA